MAISKPVFLVFSLIYSWALVANSQGIPGGDSLPCIQKLLPCQAYLKGSPSPPASCCAPLKEMIAGDSQCLCAVLNNTAILNSLNVTQDDALNLAKSCGANADMSVCQTAATPSGSVSTPPAPSTSTNSSATSAPPKSGGNAISPFGKSVGLAVVLSFLFSAF